MTGHDTRYTLQTSRRQINTTPFALGAHSPSFKERSMKKKQPMPMKGPMPKHPGKMPKH